MKRFQTLLIAITIMLSSVSVFADELDVWFGTGRNNAGQPNGIWHATFDTEKGRLSKATLALEIDGAGWISWHPTLPVMYSAAKIEGQFAVCTITMADDKTLTLAQSIPLKHSPTHLTTDQTGSLLVAAQYGGGSVVSLPIAEDGMLVDQVQLIQHEGGSKVFKNLQDAPHPHYVQIGLENNFAYVADLGLDQLVVYEIDLEAKKLTPVNRPIDCVPGGGPRHMKMLRTTEGVNREFAFVLNEFPLSVSCFEVRLNIKLEESFRLLQTIPTLAEEQKIYDGFHSASEIHIHPNGTFIYTANRGNDSISVLRFDANRTELSNVQTMPIHGSWPRNFNLTPDGKYLLAAGARTNSISVFEIHPKTGTLKMVGKPVFVPAAICVSIH